MKIAAIETFDLTCPLERPFGWSQGWIDQRSTTLVKVSTDDGLVGWGEGAAAGLIDGLLAPLLIGQDPMDRAGLWERMFHALYNGNNAVGLAGSALSALDIALWDLAGKATGLPVCALLGGKVRDKVAVYATGLYYTEGEFPDRLLDEARGYVAAGFKGMKTKVGGLSIAEDVARVRALREAIGPDIHLMVDANEAYNATTAIPMANACGIQVNPHVWGSPVMIAATLHLAATLPPCPPARNAQPYMQEPVMEFDRTPSAIRQELCAVPFDQEDSFVRVPTGPGLGIEVDEEAVGNLRASR